LIWFSSDVKNSPRRYTDNFDTFQSFLTTNGREPRFSIFTGYFYTYRLSSSGVLTA
jgi:hypothetical protein